MQKLSLQLAKAEEKLTEFREKLRDTRQELITKNRQLEVARGLVTRLGDERKLAEVGGHIMHISPCMQCNK